MDSIRLGVVEDEARLGAALVGSLVSAGVAADLLEDAGRLIARLRSSPPNIVVLSAGARRAGALDTLRRIRSVSRIPCVVVGGGISVDPDGAAGLLDAGADDLMPRATPVPTMIARMRAVLRRGAWGLATGEAGGRPAESAPALAAPRAAPTWRLVRARRELRRPDGTDCPLTTAEFDLFCLLVDQGPSPVSREAICRAVFRRRWHTEDRTADNLVVRLRRKLDDGARGTIRTVQGQGYAYLGFTDAVLRDA